MQPGNSPNGASAQPPTTGNTHGALGYSNMQLSSAPNGAKGSFIRSQKNTVKLESGTILLLRVS